MDSSRDDILFCIFAGVLPFDTLNLLEIAIIATMLAAIGAGLAFLGGHVIDHCSDRGWITDTWRKLPVPALAVSGFAVTQWLGGSGFIACFVGGILPGGLKRQL